ncbi:MAG: hypothetical protein LBJ46_06795 [Planctomycetota bacterium]|jgi:hypothetical protein|nr:hypothetical protein [Planctomycetota bacterium]
MRSLTGVKWRIIIAASTGAAEAVEAITRLAREFGRLTDLRHDGRSDPRPDGNGFPPAPSSDESPWWLRDDGESP